MRTDAARMNFADPPIPVAAVVKSDPALPAHDIVLRGIENATI